MLIRFKSKMHYVWSATNSGKLIAVEAEHTPCDDLMATAVIVATADEDWTRQMRRQIPGANQQFASAASTLSAICESQLRSALAKSTT